MTWIVDASVAVKWVAPEERHDRAVMLLDDIDLLEAPDLIFPEVTNTLWKKCARGQMSRAQARNAIVAVEQFIRTIHPCLTLYERAMEIAFILDHPAYDCFYLACAEATGGVLITADRRFVSRATAGGFAPLIEPLGA